LVFYNTYNDGVIMNCPVCGKELNIVAASVFTYWDGIMRCDNCKKYFIYGIPLREITVNDIPLLVDIIGNYDRQTIRDYEELKKRPL